MYLGISSFSSITQLSLTLCDPMDCSTPGLPVHQLPEFTQTYVHWIGGAIQPSHLSSLSLPTFNLSQHQVPFKWLSSLHQVAKVLEFQLQYQLNIQLISNEHSGLISFRMDWLDLLAVQGTLKSSPTPQFKSIDFLALSFHCSPALTSINDYWRNQSLTTQTFAGKVMSLFLICCLHWS